MRIVYNGIEQNILREVMSMHYVAGGDSGKSMTKLTLQTGEGNIRVSFPTTFEETDTKTKTDLNHEVYYQGTRYLVGEPNKKLNRINRTVRSKEQEVHKVCLLTALCLAIKEAEKDEDSKQIKVHDVTLTVNMPFDDFLDKNQRDSIVKYYQSPKMVDMTVDGEKFNLMLKVLPYYEGLGAVLLKADEIKDKRVVSVDFGSLNVNYLTIDKLKPVVAECGSLDFGCGRLLTSIKKLFSSKGIKNINADSEILRALSGDNEYISREVIEEANKLIETHVESIYSELFDLEVDVDNIQIIASGGAANLYEPFFNRIFPNKNVTLLKENTTFANAEGSLKLLK